MSRELTIVYLDSVRLMMLENGIFLNIESPTTFRSNKN